MIYVGRFFPGGLLSGSENLRQAPRKLPGAGVLLAAGDSALPANPLASELKQLADASQISLASDFSAPIIPPSYLPAPAMPPRWVHAGIASAWADTPAETISASDFSDLINLLLAYTGAAGKSPLQLATTNPSA